MTKTSTTVLKLDDRLRVSPSPALFADLKALLGPHCLVGAGAGEADRRAGATLVAVLGTYLALGLLAGMLWWLLVDPAMFTKARAGRRDGRGRARQALRRRRAGSP